MTHTDLLQLVEQAFPFLPRPPESEISFHQDECAHCEMSRKGLMKFPGTATELPAEAARFVVDEWTTLSAKATAWILPSYLRYAFRNEDHDRYTYWAPPTLESLVFNLRPDPDEAGAADEIRLRFSLLTPGQVAVLMAILDYYKNNPIWNKWGSEEIDGAIAFVSTMKE